MSRKDSKLFAQGFDSRPSRLPLPVELSQALFFAGQFRKKLGLCRDRHRGISEQSLGDLGVRGEAQVRHNLRRMVLYFGNRAGMLAAIRLLWSSSYSKPSRPVFTRGLLTNLRKRCVDDPIGKIHARISESFENRTCLCYYILAAGTQDEPQGPAQLDAERLCTPPAFKIVDDRKTAGVEKRPCDNRRFARPEIPGHDRFWDADCLNLTQP